jgi:hypothetical protein
MAKIKVNNAVKLKSYSIISQAVEDGVAYGYRRAHKHTDTPGEEGIKQAIYEAVTSQLCGIIDFE